MFQWEFTKRYTMGGRVHLHTGMHAACLKLESCLAASGGLKHAPFGTLFGALSHCFLPLGSSTHILGRIVWGCLLVDVVIPVLLLRPDCFRFAHCC